MYKVQEGKEQIAINGLILGAATQKELKHLYNLGHPYIIKTERKKKTDDENK